MSALKPWVGGVLVWGLLAQLGHAEPMTSNGAGTPRNWLVWLANARQNAGRAAAADTSAGLSAMSAPAPIAAALNNSAGVPTSSGRAADAFIDFGNGPYTEASTLTTGGAQPWYTSPAVEKFFGGQPPNSQQQTSFENAVLQEVQNTFRLSGGLNPALTLDPSQRANHTLSVVSNTSYGANANAVGITEVGTNGFSFIDKLGAAQTLTDLQTAVAHNIAHELMHAFGVASHYDQTGNYLDSATASWPMLTDPNTTFSQSAIDAMKASNFAPASRLSLARSRQEIDGDMEILASPVPEPTTIAIWGLLATGLCLVRSRRRFGTS